MKLQINIEWWDNEGRDGIPETDKNDLMENAIARVAEMQKQGYSYGELNYETDEVVYRGWWELKEIRS